MRLQERCDNSTKTYRVLCARNWFQHLMCMTSFTPPNETVMLFPLPPLYKWVNKVQREATSPVRGHTVRGRTQIWINLGSLASTPLCLIIPPNYFPVLYCLFYRNNTCKTPGFSKSAINGNIKTIRLQFPQPSLVYRVHTAVTEISLNYTSTCQDTGP